MFIGHNLFYYLLILAAVIPAAVLLVKVYQADRVEKEPPALLLSLILLGVLATGIAIVLEELGSWLLDTFVPYPSRLYELLLNFAVVGLAEEGAKFALLKTRTWKHPAFDCLFDGVVYAVFVSLGFALWENISYVVRYGLSTALLRAVTAVPGHACFGVFMGIWYGLARKYENIGMSAKARSCLTLSLLIPTLLHGCYDFVASLENTYSTLIFVVFVLGLFTAAFRLVRKTSANDQFLP